MNVEQDRVVLFHYELSDEAGLALESSRDRDPLAILFGHRNVIPGLEAALEGHTSGDRFRVEVKPEDGYGLRTEGWTQRVSKKHLPNARRLVPGSRTVLRTGSGPRTVTVLKVGSSVVDVDLNHPMAGRTLCFDVEIVDVREAAPEEIAHGHVHGPGAHGG